MGAISKRLFVVLLLAAGLRVLALDSTVRFHPDEAFFSTFARDAVSYGTWMFPGPLDKTPLSLYASALSMHVLAASTHDQLIYVDVRGGEFAARLPNVFASIVLVALVARMGAVLARESDKVQHAASLRRLSPMRARAALIPALLAATSPFLLVFAASAFTDVFMLLFMVAALLAMVQDRPGWSGLWLALSFAAKQQGLFYLPLLLALLWVGFGWSWGRVGRFLLVLAMGVALVFLWDAARGGVSVFAQAAANNAPGRVFVSPEEWPARLRQWIDYLGWSLGPPILTWPLVGVVVWWLIRVYRQQVAGAHTGAPLQSVSAYGLGSVPLFVMAGYAALYLLFHVVVATNLYDRYMLPLVPLLVLVTGHALSHLLNGKVRGGLWAISAGVLLVTALWTVNGGLALGRDAYPRRPALLPLVAHLNAKPLGTILYDRWLGWELGYYMGSWSDKRRVYYPSPEAMMADAPRNPERALRYFIAPAPPHNANVQAWLRAFQRAGFAVEIDYRSTDYQVFALRQKR